MLVTTPQPAPSVLSKYYESDAYISHTDASKRFFDKVYQMIKRYALQKKVRLVSGSGKAPGVLLDIGAGTGDFLVTAKKAGWRVFGSEPHNGAKEIAKTKEIDLSKDTKNFASESFDVITMWHVLEHVPDLEKQLKELKRLLKPNGTIFIAVPNYRSYDALHYGNYWAAYDVPRHLWHFSKSAISKLFQAHHIELQKILPMKFDAFYVALLSEKYKTGKMKVCKAFCIGMRSNWYGRRKKEHSSHIYVLKNKKK